MVMTTFYVFVKAQRKSNYFAIPDLIRDQDPRPVWEQDLEQHSWIRGLHFAYTGITVEKNRKWRIYIPR